MRKNKLIGILIFILICVCFIFSGINFSNTNKIAEELGLENLKNFSLGKARQIENILPDKNEISIFNLGYLLNDEIGISFFSITRLVAITILTYNLINIFSRNSKIKLIGTLGIAFSSLVLLDFSNRFIDILIFSEMILVAVQNILYNQKIKKVAYLFNLSIIVSMASIVLLFDLELIICSLFIIIPILIYILMKDKEKQRKKLLIITLGIGIILSIVLVVINLQNISTEVHIKNKYATYMLSYLNTTFLGFKDIEYLSEYTNIYSLFPLPLILAVGLILKSDKKENDFLFIMLAVCTWLVIGVCATFNGVLAKVLLVGFVSAKNLTILINFFTLLCLLYMLDKSEMELDIQKSVTIILVSVIFTVFAVMPAELSATIFLIIVAGIYSVLGYMICRKDDKKYKNVLLNLLIIYMAIVGISQIHIVFGSDILKLENNEIFADTSKSGTWIVLENNYVIPEYLENSGIKVINTNINMIEKFKFKNTTEYEDEVLWSYYKEAIFKIGIENTLSLNDENILVITVTEDYLKSLDVKYLLTSAEDFEKEEVYKNDKIFIYKF